MSIILPNFLQAKPVLIVGDVMLDRYWSGPTTRISPEAPVPVVQVQTTIEKPGGAGNVALNVASLGGSVELYGLCGKDEAAVSLKQQLKQANIGGQLYPMDIPTITKLRVLSVHQQLIRLDFEETSPTLHNVFLQRIMDEALGKAGVLVLSDYGKGMLVNPQPLIEKARSLNIPVLVDPKSTSFTPYTGATLITPNQRELEAVIGPWSNEEELIEKSITLCKKHAIQALLVTLGAQGMTLIQPDHPKVHLPTQAREVFDVTGAGDTVIGVMAASLAAGTDLTTAMTLANKAAGIVVGKLGAATVTIEDLQQVTSPKTDFKSGIIHQDHLCHWVTEAKRQGETIVMTNGCFDILHAGHIRYLTEAKQLGDRLIVAVNSDESIKRLKGADRPINPLSHRMTVLAALAAVDWVVSFTEDTPEALINLILPSVLVKGGDWSVENIVGSQAVLANGGQVKSLTFHGGLSTTNLIQRVRGEL